MGDFHSAIGDLNHALELDPRDIQASSTGQLPNEN